MMIEQGLLRPVEFWQAWLHQQQSGVLALTLLFVSGTSLFVDDDIIVQLG